MPFKKGKSGNPSGRPKLHEEVRFLAGLHCKDAIKTLVELMVSGEDGRTRIAAATSLLDRAVGKPSQAITGEDGAAIKIDTSGETVLSLLRKLAGESSNRP